MLTQWPHDIKHRGDIVHTVSSFHGNYVMRYNLAEEQGTFWGTSIFELRGNMIFPMGI